MRSTSSGNRPTVEAGASGRRSLPRWYGIALFSIAAALLLRWLLTPVLQYNFPFITLWGASFLQDAS